MIFDILNLEINLMIGVIFNNNNKKKNFHLGKSIQKPTFLERFCSFYRNSRIRNILSLEINLTIIIFIKMSFYLSICSSPAEKTLQHPLYFENIYNDFNEISE